MPFAKGKSGNPGGRPKALKDVEAAARTHTDLAIRTLAEIAGDGAQPAAARVSASTAILDRAWGKPTQMTEHSGPGGGPIEVEATRVSLAERIARLSSSGAS